MEGSARDDQGDPFAPPRDGWDWASIVQEIARLTGADSGSVVISDSCDDKPTVGCFHNIDPEWIGAYDTRFHQYDPTFEILAASPERVHVDHVTGARPAELTGPARTLYHEFMRPQRLRHTLALGVPGNSDREVALVLYRSAARGPFESGAIRALGRIRSELQRGLDRQAELDRIVQGTTGFRKALEQAPLGVLLLNARGQALFVNARAQALLRPRQQLVLERGRLSSPNPVIDRRLGELTRGAALAARGAAGSGGGDLFVDGSREGGRLGIRIDALRISGTGDVIGMLEPRVIVWISPAGPSKAPSARQLREAYPLTAAEAELLAGLVLGRSLADIAAARRVSRETVRTQLKGLMAKFGVHRQADLVRCVLCRSMAGSSDSN